MHRKPQVLKSSSSCRSLRQTRGLGVLAVASTLACAIAFEAAPAHAQGGPEIGPCDDLIAYLREPPAGFVLWTDGDRRLTYREQESEVEDGLKSTQLMAPRNYAARVTPACRADARRGAASAAVAAARALLQRGEPAWIDRGHVLLCLMQDPGSLGEVAAWIDDPDHSAVRAVCVSALATWPDAKAVRDQVLGRSVRKSPGNLHGRWEIDPAVVAAAGEMGTPELLEALLPVLAAARDHQAFGYDRLRDTVCMAEGTPSEEHARACATLPVDAEEAWRRSRLPAQLLVSGALTAAFVGSVVGAYVERHDETGRRIATGAGVPLGALVGMVVGAGVGVAVSGQQKNAHLSTRAKVLMGASTIAGTVAGGVLGGWATHALAASPGNRATVTGVALAPIYFGTEFLLSFD